MNKNYLELNDLDEICFMTPNLFSLNIKTFLVIQINSII